MRNPNFIAALLLIALPPVAAGAENLAVGQRVFFVRDAFVDGKEIDLRKLLFPLKIDQVDGQTLRMGRIWVHRSEVLLPDEALEHFNHYLEQHPDDVTSRLMRGMVWREKHKFDDAIADFTEAIRLEPERWEGYYNRAHSWRAKGELDKSIDDSSEAIRIEPWRAAAYVERGITWQVQGRKDKALEDYSTAVFLEPTSDVAHRHRGELLDAVGRCEGALEDFLAAVQLNPKSAGNHNDLAWFRATCHDANFRDGAEAVRHARLACDLTGGDSWYCLGTLGAAHAEAGDFPAAIQSQEKAIRLAPPHAQQELQDQLELFKAGKPYHRQPAK
jgi:tetratricopeptide (TPR) repeat protein